MIGKKHIYEFLVKEQHLDSFGHVNNAVYLTLFEEARWDLVTQNGYGLEETAKRKLGPVILEVTLKFRRELRLRERILVETHLAAYSRKIGSIHQEMKNEKGETCAIADFKFGLFNMVTRRLVHPTPEWLKGVGAT